MTGTEKEASFGRYMEQMVKQDGDISNADAASQQATEADSGMFNDALSLTDSNIGSEKENRAVKRKLDRGNRKTVKLNIGGSHFEVYINTLRRYPDTRLARLASDLERDESYREECDDFYFDRNAAAFSDILQYYRCGELHLDQTTCGAIFKTELNFWEICEEDINRCCFGKYDSHRATNAIYKELDKLFEGPKKIQKPRSSTIKDKLQFYLFHTIEDPSFSVAAKIFVLLATLITMTSVFVFVAESHWWFQETHLQNGTVIPAADPSLAAVIEPVVACCCSESDHEGEGNHPDNETDVAVELEHHDEHHGHGEHLDPDSLMVFHYLDRIAYAYFICELLLRFIVSYEKKSFCQNTYNLLEMACIIAHSISLIEHAINTDAAKRDPHLRSKQTSFILKALRAMKVFRLLRLYRYMEGFKILIYTMAVSAYELMLVFGFLFAAVLIFASLIYFAEESTFYNIPYATWWALVTMTTVGYGDVVPKTPIGYIIGSLCVACGALVVAFTVPIVVSNFTAYYTISQSRKEMEKLGKRRHMARDVISKWKVFNIRKSGSNVQPLGENQKFGKTSHQSLKISSIL